LNVLDLFSGIGGFSLGLERAGMRTVAFCEIEPFPRAVLAKHWPRVPCYSDVRSLTVQQLRADGIEGIGLVCGGFPCQDISLAGKGAGLEGERSGLWFEYARIIREVRPRWVLIENVPALRTRGYDRVKSDLEEAGYACWAFVVGARDVGMRHQRKRAWVVAYCNSEQLREQPRRWSGQSGSCAAFTAELSKDVGYSGSERLQAGWPVLLSAVQVQPVSASRSNPLAVAGPGEPQRAWEESRLVERPVGGAVDGLPAKLVRLANAGSLKAFGNSVVPQIPEVLGKVILRLDEQIRAAQAAGG
jgi:DNA (cytosine-5)-methyltransferase 1